FSRDWSSDVCSSDLRKTVTKSTAVSCHWIRGRRRSELLWIVGNRNKFNSEGIVPVNSTRKKLDQNKWENNWHYLPLIKALVAVRSEERRVGREWRAG